MSKAARRSLCEIAALESRLLMATPSSPRPETLTWFDAGERSELIERLDLLGTQSTLRSTLQSSVPNFDSALQQYFRTRSGPSWFVDISQASMTALGSYTSINLPSSASVVSGSNTMVDSRLFPASGSSSTTVNVPGNINFTSGLTGAPTDDVLYLNGLQWLQTLAQSAWVSGNPGKYIEEITFQLADWSDEFRAVSAPPAGWSADNKSGWFFTSANRADSLLWSYFTILGASQFSSVDHSLLLYKIMQHADYLYDVAGSADAAKNVASNRYLAVAKSLTLMAKMFPEFDNASKWRDRGVDLLQRAMDAQFFVDGSHIEQSPGYAMGATEDLLDVALLARRNNDNTIFPPARVQQLDRAIEAYRQFLTPDGKRPAIGDTYRTASDGFYLRAGFAIGRTNPATFSVTTISLQSGHTAAVGDYLISDNSAELMRVTSVSGTLVGVSRGVAGTTPQNVNSTIYDLGNYPFAKPRTRDMFMLGSQRLQGFMRVPAAPVGLIDARGKTFVMPDSGNFIARSNDSSTATQITFDAGPKGGIHGHNDLLNFELWSGGRPLIMDPGLYKYDGSNDQKYVQSTRAHNTINVDGQNTGEVEGSTNPSIIRSSTINNSFAQFTGTHFAYAHLPGGGPVVTRSIWYNYSDTMLVVDFVEGNRSRTYQQSFNVSADVAANTTGTTNGEFKTRFSDGGGNVRVVPLLGGTLTRGSMTFVTSDPTGDYKDDAWRFTNTKTGEFAVFATLIQVYNGLTTPPVTATVTSSQSPTAGSPVTISLTRNGNPDGTATFAQPALPRVPAAGPPRGLDNDLEYDSAGNLHLVFTDRDTGSLRYSVRDVGTGKWSVAQIIDNTNGYMGAPDLKLDNTGRPGVAYFSGGPGDLRYAILSSVTNRWEVQTVDNKGSVGKIRRSFIRATAMPRSSRTTTARWETSAWRRRTAGRVGASSPTTKRATWADSPRSCSTRIVPTSTGGT
jgi:hypothetical protein